MVLMFVFIFNFLTMKNIVTFYLSFSFLLHFLQNKHSLICVSQFTQLNSCTITLSTITRVVFLGEVLETHWVMLNGGWDMPLCYSLTHSLHLHAVPWKDLGTQEVWLSTWWSRLWTEKGGLLIGHNQMKWYHYLRISQKQKVAFHSCVAALFTLRFIVQRNIHE